MYTLVKAFRKCISIDHTGIILHCINNQSSPCVILSFTLILRKESSQLYYLFESSLWLMTPCLPSASFLRLLVWMLWVICLILFLFHFTSIKETSGRVKHYMKKATKYTCRPVREYH